MRRCGDAEMRGNIATLMSRVHWSTGPLPTLPAASITRTLVLSFKDYSDADCIDEGSIIAVCLSWGNLEDSINLFQDDFKPNVNWHVDTLKNLKADPTFSHPPLHVLLLMFSVGLVSECWCTQWPPWARHPAGGQLWDLRYWRRGTPVTATLPRPQHHCHHCH